VNLSQDDVKSFVGKLVEKGEIAKKDGEKILKSFADRVQQTVKREPKAKVEEPAPAPVAAADVGAAEKAAAALNQEKLAEKINASIERVLHGMNIATRKDVEELSKQLEDLDRKFAHLVETAAAGRGARKAHVAPEHGAAS
jgi:polyhydroxyalkanoate synthesis regulator phasin